MCRPIAVRAPSTSRLTIGPSENWPEVETWPESTCWGLKVSPQSMGFVRGRKNGMVGWKKVSMLHIYNIFLYRGVPKNPKEKRQRSVERLGVQLFILAVTKLLS